MSVVAKREVSFSVNGRPESVQVYPMARLLDVLRENLKLTGVKEGCGEGECGACSILLDGKLVTSCLVPVLQAQGSEIVTIEGLADSGQLHALQEAFLLYGGSQCGICTPGMIVAAFYLLKQVPHPSEAEIREGLAGNLCRCTGYQKIFESVVRASNHEEVTSDE
ncbi:MAG TPA: (2Fe-2S)-binding protein [Terriglobia bacterium]|nr:(2Fe-2S)-binding protein [Terriglobia bacterium]